MTGKTIPAFLYLPGQLAPYEHLDPPDEHARSRLTVEILQDRQEVEGSIGRLGDRPAGFVTFCFMYSTFLARHTLYLEDIFVPEEYRKRGLGTRLFTFCRNEARVRGCGRMDRMVLVGNTPSI